ncbi:elongation factor P [Buchnera aphidicola]|uniref:elongation factor P n=1 Tax=Buchnera aphidicola TaxID=9 RepID=UPI003463CA89
MILYYTNHFKSGLKVIFENFPYCIESVQFVKPGKGQSFSRVKLRNLLNKQLIEKTFRSTDCLKHADIIDINLLYLYHDSKFLYFMNEQTFDQILVEKFIIQDKMKWLIEQHNYLVTLWNDKPIGIIINNFVELKVINVTPEVSSDVISNVKNTKFCQVTTGAILKVPLFIQEGDIIKVDIRTEKYHSRINR